MKCGYYSSSLNLEIIVEEMSEKSLYSKVRIFSIHSNIYCASICASLKKIKRNLKNQKLLVRFFYFLYISFLFGF